METDLVELKGSYTDLKKRQESVDVHIKEMRGDIDIYQCKQQVQSF